ncbi:MAG: small multi-drug export protein [Halobacteriales archaeon]|nr:small multi-drug export protein [Halobacteriales archaeon]
MTLEAYARRIAERLNLLPPELVVIVFAASPVLELRGAIPLAVGFYGMSPFRAFALGVFGNLLPVLPLLFLLGRVSNFLAYRYKVFERFFAWLFERTRERVEDRYKKYGALILVPLVALPLPGTGAWTGCAAAFIFGIEHRYSVPAIFAGVIIAGILVTAASAGFFSLF